VAEGACNSMPLLPRTQPCHRFCIQRDYRGSAYIPRQKETAKSYLELSQTHVSAKPGLARVVVGSPVGQLSGAPLLWKQAQSHEYVGGTGGGPGWGLGTAEEGPHAEAAAPWVTPVAQSIQLDIPLCSVSRNQRRNQGYVREHLLDNVTYAVPGKRWVCSGKSWLARCTRLDRDGRRSNRTLPAEIVASDGDILGLALRYQGQ
jgi:hypothetical protein